MRTVRLTTLAFGLLLSIAVVPAVPASASEEGGSRCTQFKVALRPVYPDRPIDWVRSVRVSGPELRCEPLTAHGGEAVKR